MNYDLWFIMLDISSRRKYELIDTYGSTENVYNNYENIVNSSSTISKKLEKYKKSDFYEKTLKLEDELYKNEIKYITGVNPLYKDKLDGILEK
ncbi:MAG: DNA-protecting protein DprA, partial [Clostridium sp.]|nr:DNA-protecting protein DprA [Clostridium sp.]